MVKKRKIMILVMFILLPIIVNYFSPVVVLIGSLNGFITASFVIWSLMFLSSIFVGRSFCSYICPYGGLQMLCDKVLEKKLININWLRKIRYLIGIIWLGLLIYNVAIRLGDLKLNTFFNTENYVSTDSVGALIRYYIIVGSMVLFSCIFGKRSVCHYVCPMSILNIIGSKISSFLRLPALRLRNSDNQCIHCKKCNRACPMSLEVEKMVGENNMTDTECINCGECAKVCPNKCIDYKFQI